MVMQTESKDIYLMMQKDQEKGLRMIMARFSEPLYWHIRRLLVSHDDTQDALQNTFVKVYRSFHTLKEPASLNSWIYRIATHEALDMKQRQNRANHMLDSSEDNTANIAAESYIDYSDLEAVKLQKAILSLPPKQQVVFNLRYYDEMNFSDISNVTGTTLSTAKVNYHLAKEKIIRYMNSND